MDELRKVEKESVHWVLTHSYAMYFVLLLVGITLDLIYKLKIFHSFVAVPVGVVALLLGTVILFWTEHASRHFKHENLSKENFCIGPYCYTRSPVHWGMLLLTLGFGLILNAFFVVLSTAVSFLVAKFVFQTREERALESKYGIHYSEYKKLVKF